MGPSEYLADFFIPTTVGPQQPKEIWRQDVPDPTNVQIEEYGGSLSIHCAVNSELGSARGNLPILYVDAPPSGLWEARVTVRVAASDVAAGFTVYDRDGDKPDFLFGFDRFAARGFGASGGIAALRYGTAGLSGTIGSEDLGSLSVEWVSLKIERAGNGRYDLWYNYKLGSDVWLAPDDASDSDPSIRQRVFVKTAGEVGDRLFLETEWRLLAEQVESNSAGRRIGLYVMTGSSGGAAKFRTFLVRNLFPQSVASYALDDGSLRESLDSAGTPITVGTVAPGRDGYTQGALRFNDGSSLALPFDPLEKDALANGSLHEFTISLWIKPHSAAEGGILGRRLAQHLPDFEISPSISMTSDGGVVWVMQDELGQNYSQRYYTPQERPYAPVLPSSASTSLTKVLEVDEWTHLTFVKQADTVVFYRNGLRWGFSSLAPDVQSNAYGQIYLNFLQDLPLHGSLDDVRFYDVGLADFAVEHLFGNADVDTLRSKSQRCFAGSPCELAGLVGEGLSDLNKYAVLTQCGRSPAVPGMPNGGISDFGTSQQAYWGYASQEPLTAGGGYYKICWCGGGSVCATPEDFKVLVGTLVVVGPYLGQERTCTLGQVAAFDITGVELDAGDQLQILDTCGLNLTMAGVPQGAASDLQPSACYGHVGLGVLDALHAHGSGLTGKTQSECCALCQRSLYSDCVIWVYRPSDMTCFLYRSVARVERQEDRVLGVVSEWGTAPNQLVMATVLTGQRVGANSTGPFRLYVCRSSQECLFTTSLDLSNLDMGYQTFQTAILWPTGWDWSGIKIFSDTEDRWFLEGLVVTALGVSWNFTYSGWIELGAEVYLTRAAPSQYAFGGAWGAETVSMASGGQYRLCWCSGSAACDLFAADAGALTIVGPSPLEQHQTCITGQPCNILGLSGFALSAGDKVMVLDTCGQTGLSSSGMIWDGASMTHASLVPRFSSACRSPMQCLRDVPCDNDMHSLYEKTALGCGISDAAENAGADLSWGGGAAYPTPPGGSYKVCWCANGQTCSMFEHFKVELGGLTILGPSSMEQHRTCVAGQACVVSNIAGHGLQHGDRMMVLDDCGKTSYKPMCPYHPLENEAESLSPGYNATLALQGCGVVTDRWPGSSYGTGVLQLAISEPAISSAHPCGSSMKWIPYHPDSRCYSVFSSQLTWDDAEAACDAIYGGHLASVSSQNDLDFLVEWVLDPTVAYWIGLNDQAVEGTFTYTDGSTFAFSNWGVHQPALTLSNNEDCVYLLGDGTFHDDACTVARTYLCERDGAFSGAVNGDEFRFGGFRTARENLVPPSSAGGQYRMCWCPYGYQCNDPADFRMDFGDMTLVGPSPLNQHKTCVAGQPCELWPLNGMFLQNNDLVHILETCGAYVNVSKFDHFSSTSDSGLHLPRFPSNGGIQSLSQGATNSGASVSWGSVPITAMGGRYRMCWCAAGYSCSAVPEFRVDFGRRLSAHGRDMELWGGASWEEVLGKVT